MLAAVAAAAAAAAAVVVAAAVAVAERKEGRKVVGIGRQAIVFLTPSPPFLLRA